MNADLRRQLHKAVAESKRLMAEVSGANAPEMKAAAAVLRRSIRKELSRKSLQQGPQLPGAERKHGGSAPGQAPAMRTGQLRRSIRQEIVGGVMRVGSGYFTSRLLEGGVNAALTPRRRKGSLRRKKGERIRLKATSKSRLVIAPRPFMGPALERAIPEMEKVLGYELQRQVERRGGGAG